MIAERGEFKGHPTLILKNQENDKFPFTIGAKKARLILEHIDDIKMFAEENPPKQAQPKAEY